MAVVTTPRTLRAYDVEHSASYAGLHAELSHVSRSGMSEKAATTYSRAEVAVVTVRT